MDTTRETKEQLEKRSGERNVDRHQEETRLQLEEDGGGSTRQSWMEQVVCGLCSPVSDM